LSGKGIVVVFLLYFFAHASGAAPLCEWQGDGGIVNDPCPEFFWECDDQTAFRIIVSSSKALAERVKGDMWNSGRVETPLTIAEYAGKPLRDGSTYWWRLKIWHRSGEESDFSSPKKFSIRFSPLPSKRNHIRTFVNFGSKAEIIADRYDLTMRVGAKKFNPHILAVNYSLLATMVIPSEKAEMLERFCIENGLTKKGIAEEMFLHFSEDTDVTLHVGAERAANPLETRRIPGWDPANDRNGDGYVDDEEFANLANPRAHARRMSEARVPIYFWGPPRDDFVMNVGNKMYQRFLAEVYAKSRLSEGYDGLFIDTTTPYPPGVAARSELFEYPRKTPLEKGAWLRDMQTMLARVKIAIMPKLLLANGWKAEPFVIDGMEWENWLNISSPLSKVESRLEAVSNLERRGKIQLVQYNPIYDPDENEFGRKVPVSKERDRIFGLALYYLVAGDRTYFGFGQHPYVHSERKFFGAVEFDIGRPKGDYFVFHEEKVKPTGENLLKNGGFEEGTLDGWAPAEPVAVVPDSPRTGRFCACIRSDSVNINNINRQFVTLEPDTYYTLSGWIKVKDVSGSAAVQIYPHDFNDADTGRRGFILIATGGTHDWRFFSGVFKTGKDTRGRINFRICQATGTAWFDDISLVKGKFFSYKVFGREFEKALVLVRPSAFISYDDSTARKFKLPAKMRPLKADGTLGEPTNSISLRNGEAAILIKPNASEGK